MTRRTLPLALVLLLAALAVAVPALARTGREAHAGRSAASARFVLGPGGVRRIQVGRTFAYLRSRGLVGRLGPGCELAGPGQDFSADILGRLRGSVEFNAQRRAVAVSVTRGAVTSRGIGIGARLARVKQVYPRARYRLDPVFRVYFVRIPRRGNPAFTIVISGQTRRVTALAAPVLPVCE
jgi:hypothetical protein